MIKKNALFITLLMILNFLYTSCNSSDDTVADELENPVNFEEAQLFDFILSEVDEDLVESIVIKQPTMVNGVPENKGEIKIELAYTDISKFSLKQVPFNTVDFSISPDIGEQHILPGKNITFTITPSKKTEVTLQYNVLVTVKRFNPENEKLKINAFQFLNAQNPGLDEDISSSEIRKHIFDSSYDGTIVMIVPNGTDFSNLAPKITYEGSSITYKTKAGSAENFKEFTPGTFLDFKYPNQVIMRIHNRNRSEFATYRVLVDVKTPIVFDDVTAIINDGNTVSGFDAYDNIIGFTNYGNYPITSDIFVSDMNVTNTPEEVIKNYFISVILKGDDIIYTNEKGRLYAQVNFPGNLIGTFTGITSYKIDATFSIINRNFSIKKRTNVLNAMQDFDIYTPIKIELQANVFVSAP